MIKIEVKSPSVALKEGVSARTGKPYSIREQEAYAHVFGRDGNPAAYPVRVAIPLEPESQPYPPGFYTIDPISLYVDRFGSLALGRIKLKLLSSSTAQPQQSR